MKSFSRQIEVPTSSKVEIIDITSEVRSALVDSGIRDGLLTVFTRHTTTAIRVNEKEPRLQEDMLAFLDSLALPGASYRHDAVAADGRANAWGHLVALLMGASETIPIRAGDWALGPWQTIFFVELDGPREKRTVVVEVVGQ